MKKILLLSFLISASVNSFAFLSQSHWRWRKDDGSETTATWAAAEDSTLTISSCVEAIRLRISFYNNDVLNTEEMTNTFLSYSTDSLALDADWKQIKWWGDADSSHFILAGDTPNSTDGTPTTELLTGRVGFSFEAGKIITSSDSAGAHVVAVAHRTEYEYVIKPTRNLLPNTKYYFKLQASMTDDVSQNMPSLITPPAASKPDISWNGTALSTTSTGPDYQWLLSNAAVSSATSATYQPAAIGTYKIQVSNSDGCVSKSDSFNLIVTALANTTRTNGRFTAKLMPNPASSDLMIQFPEQPTGTLFIQLISTDGHVIKSVRTKDRLKVMSVSDVVPGNYFIRIQGNNYNQTQKLLINKQ